jgi:formylglycine-generating enzyme required for sulfatase activity
MRFNAEMNRSWAMGIAGWLAGAPLRGGGLGGDPCARDADGAAGGFELGRTEVTVAEFVGVFERAGVGDFPETAQIGRRADGGYAAKRGAGRQAVAEVTAAEAEAYCAWRTRETGRTVRLPTEAEWEAAARGGVDGAPYPWGWGGEPAERARNSMRRGRRRRVGRFPANGFGLRDMAGNLYEWCAAGPGLPPGRRAARGGSWAERDPDLLQVGPSAGFPGGVSRAGRRDSGVARRARGDQKKERGR